MARTRLRGGSGILDSRTVSAKAVVMKSSARLSAMGFLVLGAATLLLFVSVFTASISVPGAATASTAVILIALTAGMTHEAVSFRTAVINSPAETAEIRAGVIDFVMVVAGNALTFVLSVEAGFGAVVASSVVGLLGAMLVRKHATAIFCGSFVGMSSPDVYSYAGVVLVAGVCAGIVFVIAKHVLNGFGGKLGTIAFAGALAASFILRARLGSLPVPGGTDAL